MLHFAPNLNRAVLDPLHREEGPPGLHDEIVVPLPRLKVDGEEVGLAGFRVEDVVEGVELACEGDALRLHEGPLLSSQVGVEWLVVAGGRGGGGGGGAEDALDEGSFLLALSGGDGGDGRVEGETRAFG